jgi:hypothetical protein
MATGIDLLMLNMLVLLLSTPRGLGAARFDGVRDATRVELTRLNVTGGTDVRRD